MRCLIDFNFMQVKQITKIYLYTAHNVVNGFFFQWLAASKAFAFFDLPVKFRYFRNGYFLYFKNMPAFQKTKKTFQG